MIAQSLNQIEKTYGVNNSILDNCHVRIAFASNDERTAKRISDSLGTKTQLRAQKNYTGHRLAPWLSHMMVSRQETQRQLLTPGEVMQLSKTKALIMIAGLPAILAQKLLYYKDKNFGERVISPPQRSAQLSILKSEWNDELPCSQSNHGDGNELEISTHIEQEFQPKDIDSADYDVDTEDLDANQDGEIENLKKAYSLQRNENDLFPEF